jgi:5'-3' exonuclease
MEKIILIDADSLQYIGSNCEEVDQAYDKVDNAISKIIATSGASHYKIFIEALGNQTFRRVAFNSYKSGRKNKELPSYYKEIKQYIIETYNPFISCGVESDDSIISTHKYLKQEYPFTEIIIASMDKDYLTHEIVRFDTYYSRFGEIRDVSKEEAEFNFYKQMIEGDSIDSVSGVRGSGKVAAEKVLKNSSNCFISTCRYYKLKYRNKWKDNFKKNYFLLRIRDDVRYCSDFDLAEFE